MKAEAGRSKKTGKFGRVDGEKHSAVTAKLDPSKKTPVKDETFEVNMTYKGREE